jgi:hypothetical protein
MQFGHPLMYGVTVPRSVVARLGKAHLAVGDRHAQ